MNRWGLAAGILLFGSVLLAAGWHDLLEARSQLNVAQERLDDLVADPEALGQHAGRSAGVRSLGDASERVDAARTKISGSIPLRVVGGLPSISRQKSGTLALIADAKAGILVTRQLLRQVDGLAERTVLASGAVPLEGLREFEEAVRTAGTGLRGLQGPSEGLWSSLASARRTLNATSTRVSRSLIDGADAIRATRSFMGSGSPRRYFVGVQNNAEMRDQGMVLSYAVIRFDAGRLTVEKTGPIGDLTLERPVDVPLPDSTRSVFGSQSPLRLWQNTNATADWPLTAKAMAAMYKQATGTEVDGVIALDVPGLAAILRIIGSVPNPTGRRAITAAKAATILLHDFYASVPHGDQTLRKERLADVAATIIGKLTTGRHDAVALGRQLGGAAAGGHFRLWSKNAHEEQVFQRTGLGGGPAEHLPHRTFHLSVQNASSTKLDYYQRQNVKMDVYVTEVGTAIVRTSLVLTNTAPRNSAPSYQLGPGGATQKRPGEYPARIYFWGPRGAVQIQGISESGLTLNQTSAIVQPGERETVIFHAVIPKAVRQGRLELRLVPQPILVPASLEVRLNAPGWSVDGEKRISAPWGSTMTVGWGLER